VPEPSPGPVDRSFGRPDLDANGENRWDMVAPDSFCRPYGVADDGTLVLVADSGNSRMTLWRTQE
jgi:hypothetical protein